LEYYEDKKENKRFVIIPDPNEDRYNTNREKARRRKQRDRRSAKVDLTVPQSGK
jgi:hypothetical protein